MSDLASLFVETFPPDNTLWQVVVKVVVEEMDKGEAAINEIIPSGNISFRSLVLRRH